MFCGYHRAGITAGVKLPSLREPLSYRIRELFAEHNGMAGSPMITADLHDSPEYANVSRPRVARLMRSMGLKCRSVKKYVATTDSKHSRPASPNILDRNFIVGSPKKAWVSDITYLKVGRSWHYLTVFIDLFSRKVVGWDLSESLERYTVIRALHKTIMNRKPGEGLLIHHRRFQAVIEAEQALFNWIEVYYNRRRKHSTNNQKSSAQHELEWRNEKEVA